jgi:hypothetical protein
MSNYILRGKVAVQCSSTSEWGRWFETADRVVKKTRINDAEVSTVFLGLDHSFGMGGPPLLFETMIFGGKSDGEQWRYSTWEEAEKGHDEVVALVLGTRPVLRKIRFMRLGGKHEVC